MNFYKQLTLKERQIIHKEYRKGNTIGGIAKILGRNKSTISREIRRNGSIDEEGNISAYNGREAQRRYMNRFKEKRAKHSNVQAPLKKVSRTSMDLERIRKVIESLSEEEKKYLNVNSTIQVPVNDEEKIGSSVSSSMSE